MKTKNKCLMGIFALAVTLASCTSKIEGSDGQTEDNLEFIGFKSYATISKGLPIAGNDDFSVESNDFGVSAYLESTSSTAYLGSSDEGAKIVYSSDNGWDYNLSTDSRYWPDEALNFYAYTPHSDENRSGTLAITTDDLAITGFTVPSDITAQEDFMYAVATGITSSSDEVSSGELTLSFSHALTQINFSAKTEQTNLYAEIESIAIGNVNSVGNFSAISGWSSQATLEEYYATIESGVEIGDTLVDLTSTQSDVLMLMPQRFTAWDGLDDITDDDTEGEGAYILISCKLYNKTDATTTYYIGSDLDYGLTALPISTDNVAWSAGTKITYNIVFASGDSTSGGGGYDPEGDVDEDDNPNETLVPICFTTSVSPWTPSASDLIL